MYRNLRTPITYGSTSEPCKFVLFPAITVPLEGGSDILSDRPTRGESPAERYAYVAALAPSDKSHSEALLVVDVGAASGSYEKVVGELDLPNSGDELHHFGWNACSTALCPYAPHPHLEAV